MMRIINVISIVVLIGFLVPAFMTTYIRPDQIGVRRSLSSGIENEDFGQGRHFDVPLVHSWYHLPHTLQYVEFNGNNTLDLRTRENNVVHVDMAIV